MSLKRAGEETEARWFEHPHCASTYKYENTKAVAASEARDFVINFGWIGVVFVNMDISEVVQAGGIIYRITKSPNP